MYYKLGWCSIFFENFNYITKDITLTIIRESLLLCSASSSKISLILRQTFGVFLYIIDLYPQSMNTMEIHPLRFKAIRYGQLSYPKFFIPFICIVFFFNSFSSTLTWPFHLVMHYPQFKNPLLRIAVSFWVPWAFTSHF